VTISMKQIGVVLLVLVLVAGPAIAADPVADLKNFSDFSKVDPARLLDGEVLAERGDLMNFPNGISVQTCFAVPYPAEEVARKIQHWDPSRHSELKVFGYFQLNDPVKMEDFSGLTLKASQYPVRWLRDKIADVSAASSDLNLTHAEAQLLADCVQKSKEPEKVAPCFHKLLFGRAQTFQQGGYAHSAAYEFEKESVLPQYQLQAMIREQKSIAHEFHPILMQSGLFSGVNTNLSPVYYCNYFDADHKATVSLGAIFVLPVGDHYQVLDTEYYVCASYFASAILYEVWPIQIGNKSGALVWRGDYFAAPVLSVTKGMERLAYGAIMLQQVKQSIRYFQDDLKRKP
jgi:hypothetical protein